MMIILFSSVAGALTASFLACIPGLHIYNIMGLMAIAVHMDVFIVSSQTAIPFTAGLLVGYAVLSNIPSILLAAPDEGSMFTVLPGRKYLLNGRGYEATLMTSLGAVAGLVVLVLFVGPLVPKFLPIASAVFRKHTHWITWCVIIFMVMSEWPRGGRFGESGWHRFLDSWKSTGMGLLTMALSGLLGFLLIYRSPIPSKFAFQNLMPAFVGLFSLPWLLLNILNRTKIPEQNLGCPDFPGGRTFLRGTFAGILGGGFAAFFPVVTAGVGGMLAGHATALRDDRSFLISQGASKLVYYVGAMLLFCVPGSGITRGGGTAMLKTIYVAETPGDYYAGLAGISIAGAVCCLLVAPMTRAMLKIIQKFGYRRMSFGALVTATAIVFGVTGGAGLGIMVTATGIGLLPVLFGARRMNCLGIILLPIACEMSGIGAIVAGFLGLL
ncbi:MAG: tripartite tricarboxylate transporter permease [Kiritimatiellae bacterium]|nr:tripartite tricarboxylate transporter permease [Kiritimatiellia bacterium]